MIPLKQKKGDMVSIFVYALAILFLLAIDGLVFGKVITGITGNLQEQEVFTGANGTNVSGNSLAAINMVDNRAITYLDYLFFFAMIAGIIGLIISSLYIDTSPAFIVGFLLLLVVAMVIGGVMANAYTEMGESDGLSDTYDQFTLTRTLMNNFVLILFITGLTTAIILYGKSKAGGVT